MSIIQKLTDIKTVVDNALNKDNKTLTESIQNLKDKSETYLIFTTQDLEQFIQEVNNGRSFLNAKLMNDINFGRICQYNPSAPSGDYSKMIGTIENPYRGIFNGQNYTITIDAYVNHRNLDNTTIITLTDDFRVGLFNTIQNATIKNLKVNGQMIIDHQNSTNTKIGGICAYAENSTFINCISEVNITGTPNSSSSGLYNVGGVVGYMTGICHMSQCGNKGNQKIHGYNQGGLIGYQNDSITPSIIQECYNHGTIEGYRNVGGLIGRPGGCQQIAEEEKQFFDLKSWILNARNDPNIWDNLKPTIDENIKYIGSKTTNDVSTDINKKAYKNLNELNSSFSINETISSFNNINYQKRLWFNSAPNETYPWILAYWSQYHNGLNDSVAPNRPERSQLAFNIYNQKPGYYMINFEVMLESWLNKTTTGAHPIFENLYYGGGTFEIEVNGVKIPNILSCKGNADTHNTLNVQSTFQIYLPEGNNVISLYRNAESRSNLYLNNFEIAPCQESFIGRSYDIKIDAFEEIDESICEILSGQDCIEKIDPYQTSNGESLVNDYLHKFTDLKTGENWYIFRFKTIKKGSIKAIIKSKNEEIKYDLNLCVLPEEELIRTSIIKNCYNSGVFDSYNYYNAKAHYSGGLFGNVNLKVSSLYHGLKIKNCYVSGITPEPHVAGENRDGALFSGGSSGLVGIFENVYLLEDCGRDPVEFDSLDADNRYYILSNFVSDTELSSYYFTETSLTKPFIFLGKYPVLNWEYDINEANRQMIENAGPEVYYTENQIGVGAFKNKYNLKQIILSKATILPPYSLDIFYNDFNIDTNLDCYLGYINKLYAPKCQYIQDYACPMIHTFDTKTSITIAKNGFTSYDLPQGWGLNCLLLRNSEKISILIDIEAFLNTNIYYKIINGGSHLYTEYTGIYVPASLLEQYKTATNWSYYSKVIRSIEGIEYDEIINSSTSTEEEIEQAKLKKAEVLKITGGWVV